MSSAAQRTDAQRRVRRWFLADGFGLGTAALFVLALLASGAGASQRNQQSQVATPGMGALEGGETELQTGTRLTSQGRFAEAVPHLLAARGHVAERYAVNFNLALCYVGLREPKSAIPILEELRGDGNVTPAVWNLLAQAYVGTGQSEKAFGALRRAAALTPDDEKLYAYVADACTEAHNNELGLKVVDFALRHVPRSARLHYQRAVFLTSLDDFQKAKGDFELAARLAPGSEISYIASAHEALIEGDLALVIRTAREAIAQHKDGYIVLSMLGQALIRSGVDVGDPGFSEAQKALEKSIAERPDYPGSRILLAQLDLMDGRVDDAIAQLDAARPLDPQNPAVYSHLATALRRKGDRKRLREALEVLARLNQRQVTAIRDAGTKSGEHRGNIASVHNQ
jgi:predicted Zn-dependent protease